MGLVSMWEHLSHAMMGFPDRSEQSAAAAQLDAALRHVFPYTHGNITQADREALVRRQICTRQDLSRFECDDDIASALPDVSPRTRTKLYCGSGVFSVKDAIEEPMASLPKPYPVNMTLETRASTAHTIEQKYSWRGFGDQAQQLCVNLDDTPTLRKRLLPSRIALDYWQGTESDLHLACYQQLRFIDHVAERTPSIASRSESAGGMRSFTHVSFRVRDGVATAGSPAEENPACTSAVVKIVTKGDLQVNRGDTWDMICADKVKLKRIEPALEQVFACAVEEEVAVAAVTSYEVTLFIKRSVDITEKKIWVSDPVWFDQTQPSARACWLNFMQQAHLTYPAKPSLARELVPFTGPGLRLQMRCDEAVRVSRKRGRDHACPSSGIERPDMPELSYSIAFADLHETAMVHSSYSRPFAKLKEGQTHGVKTIIKTYNGSDQDAIDKYEAELRSYGKLKELQGLHIPRLLFWGPLQDSSNPTLVLEHCGISLEKIPVLTSQHKQAARRAVRALHRKGAVHGLLDVPHFVWNADKKRMVLVDLAAVSFRESNSASFSEDLYNEKCGFQGLLDR